MSRRSAALAGLILTLASALPAQAAVLESVRSGAFRVTLSTPAKTLVQGSNPVTVAITDSKGKPARVKVEGLSVSMAAMPGMAAQKAPVVLAPARKPGVATGRIQIPFGGTWQALVVFADKHGLHRVSFKVLAR